MNKSRLAPAFFLFSALGFGPFAKADVQIRFLDHGKDVKKMSLLEMTSHFKEHNLTVWEPHEDIQVSYHGFTLSDVLDEVYGKSWRDSELVLFICSDGYKSPVPTSRIKTSRALLAERRADQNGFTLNNRFTKEKNIPLSPFYLVWDNIKNPVLRAEEPHSWPYQIVGFDLVSFKERFAKMVPDAKSSKNVLAGFQLFQENCMFCHSIHGDGGGKGPELMAPDGALQVRGPKWVKSWVADPTKTNKKTTMPTFGAFLDGKSISQIVDYLEAKSKN